MAVPWWSGSCSDPPSASTRSTIAARSVSVCAAPAISMTSSSSTTARDTRAVPVASGTAAVQQKYAAASVRSLNLPADDPVGQPQRVRATEPPEVRRQGRAEAGPGEHRREDPAGQVTQRVQGAGRLVHQQADLRG